MSSSSAPLPTPDGSVSGGPSGRGSPTRSRPGKEPRIAATVPHRVAPASGDAVLRPFHVETSWTEAITVPPGRSRTSSRPDPRSLQAAAKEAS